MAAYPLKPPMPRLIEPETARLRLRQWSQADREPFAAMSADPRVMEYFPATLTREESDAMVTRCQTLIAERGWGFWATECKATGEFIGMVGLHVPSAALPFSPCVEVGWRLAAQRWGQGFATEAAREALRVGFEDLALQEIVAFTTLCNARSRAVMHRLGMRDADRFENPSLPEGHPQRPHALYRLARADFHPIQQQLLQV